MSRRSCTYLILTVALSLAGCGEEPPTQPSVPVNPDHSAASMATAASNTWAPVAPMPGSYGFGPAIGVVSNAGGQSKAYVFGGTDGSGGSGVGVRIYDVATNTWSLTKDPTADRVYVFNANGVGIIGGKLYFSGGYDYGGGSREIQSLLWAFDPVAETLTRKADMPLHTANGVSGVIGGRLYVLPGTCSGDGWPYAGYCETEPIRRLYRYNPANDTWVTRALCPHYHRNGVGGVINDKFYVVSGGERDQFTSTADLDVYDPAGNTWKSLTPLPNALHFVVGAVLQGKLDVIGQTAGGIIRHYAYVPATNKWITKAPPATYGGPAAKVLLNGDARLLVLNGATDDYPDGSQMYTP